MKPYSAERFESALERARQRLHLRQPAPTELAQTARGSGIPLERILIKEGARVHIVPIAQVDYLEAQDDYVAVHNTGRKFLKQQTISSLEAALDPQRFVRIHRSYIVNVEKIVRIEPYSKDSRVAVLQDGTRLPVSQSGFSRLSKLME